jgi:hypothetical protein
MHSVTTQQPSEDQAPETIPYSLPLELTVVDPEVVAELCAKQEGRERDEYALGALRLGVLAFKQARGQIPSLPFAARVSVVWSSTSNSCHTR